MRAVTTKWSVRAIQEHIGVEVSDIDLSQPLRAEDVQALRKLMLDHVVVLFRNQNLQPEDQLRFGSYFGQLFRHPALEVGETTTPELLSVSNVGEFGRLGTGELHWHSDGAFRTLLPTFSFLYALEVPPEGGATSVCNLYGAYDALPAKQKHEFEALAIRHDNLYNSSGKMRGVISSANARGVDVAKGAVHPIIMEHPETGRKLLYVGKEVNSEILGIDSKKAGEVIREIVAIATQSEIVYSHRWRNNDLLVWDNRSSMHKREAFSDVSRRVMRRCIIIPGSAGERLKN